MLRDADVLSALLRVDEADALPSVVVILIGLGDDTIVIPEPIPPPPLEPIRPTLPPVVGSKAPDVKEPSEDVS